MSHLLRSAPFLTLVASFLSVFASFAIPYSQYLFSATFSWLAFLVVTLLPIDRFFIFAADSLHRYRRIDVVICSTCIVLSTVCASLLGERGNGLASVLIPLLVHILRFQYMHNPTHLDQDQILEKSTTGTTNVDMSTLVFISFTSFLALSPNYPGASQLVLGMCSGIFAATYLSISDISIPLNRAVLREISAYTCFGLLLMSLLLDGWAGWSTLGTDYGLASMIILWSIFSAAKNFIILLLIQHLSPINASFVDLIGILSTTLYTHAAWKVAAMCVSYMAIASTLLPPPISEIKVRYVKIRLGKFITLTIGMFLFFFGIFVAIKPRIGGHSKRVLVSNLASNRDTWNTTIHPISYLMEHHTDEFSRLVERQSTTYPETVTEYRRRYKINPPPNFDKWYAFATEKKVRVFDDYDSIYNNLRPFWSFTPVSIRESVHNSLGPDSRLLGVFIRSGSIVNTTGGGEEDAWFVSALTSMVSEFVEYLPDMDLAFNLLDQARVIIPSGDLGAILNAAMDTGTKNEFSGLPVHELAVAPAQVEPEKIVQFVSLSKQPTWSASLLSCNPSSPAKSSLRLDSTTKYALSFGFIKNVTASTDVCLSPSYRHEHGVFNSPKTFSFTTEPVPIFSKAKLSSFGDILYPSPEYFVEKAHYDETKDKYWRNKQTKLYWRGATTGLQSSRGEWKSGHRQRAVAYFNDFNGNCTMLMDIAELEQWNFDKNVEMANLTPVRVKRDEQKDVTQSNDEKPDEVQEHDSEYKQEPQHEQQHEFIEQLVAKKLYDQYIDLQFSAFLQCEKADCDIEQQYFGDVALKSELQDSWDRKYLVDIDDNSFSPTYYALLQSRSAVVKQTLFREWHDERLIPWVHYIPLSTKLTEGFGILKFFLENDSSGKYIADQSRRWSRQALRKEDMSVYFFRLLLEYGRLVDDNREIIGCI
ncbi:hypothetical protein V1514DRAFT_338793 [Lipomyces japonicus]|uniref:uncharacterized protein n=1 Tax=Lipomyces japonicus TaxID=56871 RepID=UPI0034CF7389